MFKIIQKRKIWLTLSSIAIGLSIVALIIWGLNFGIDFTGGSLLEVKFLEKELSVGKAQEALAGLDLASLTIQPTSENGMIFRFQDTTEEKHQAILERLNKALTQENPKPLNEISGQEEEAGQGREIEVKGEGIENLEIKEVAISDAETDSETGIKTIEELRFDSVGPSIGQELKRKSLYAIIAVLLAIVFYIAWVFRKVSKPVASWKYGLTAIFALFHDVMIVLGIFAVLGRFASMEINTAFVAAVLTVLGYSVNDTIVVFDRVRENLPRSDEDFEGTVNTSVNQTLTRSVNTSLTTLLILLSIFFFGGLTIRSFILALTIGVFIGTYSSIFLASPILVVWEKFKK